jgi:SagB-type dehydrogenase family enzyme
MIRIANLLESELNFRPKMDEFYRVPTIVGLAESYEQHRLQGQRIIREAERTPEPLPESILASFRLLTDPEEREAFKNTQPGLRGTDDDEPPVQWTLAESDGSLREQYAERRSYRHFGKEPIAAEQFGKWMGCLRQRPLNGKPKYLYASAGGLYPVQTYLYIKPGRVDTLAAGTYYYHPKDHRLMLLSANVDLDRGIYDPFINAPIFDEAAFAVFLIAQLGAIVPMYGERSLHYASIEAGLMAQLLEMSAPAYGMGLCQIGTLEFQRIRHFFALDEDHVLVHSLLGGSIDTQQQSHWSSHQEPYYHMPSMEEEREEGEI